MAPTFRRSAQTIFVGVPTRGQVGWATVTRLQQIRDANPGLVGVLYQPGHLSVAQTRNRIVKAFLETDCEVLVMVDDDVVPPLELLTIASLIPSYAMVGVPTLVWNPVAGLHANVYDEEHRPLRSTGKVTECAYTGLGCAAISRDAIEDCIPFRVKDEVSDDILFCDALRDTDYRIAADFRLAADHHTTVSLAAVGGF